MALYSHIFRKDRQVNKQNYNIFCHKSKCELLSFALMMRARRYATHRWQPSKDKPSTKILDTQQVAAELVPESDRCICPDTPTLDTP